MTKRIFRSTLFVAVVVLIACFATIMGVLYGHFHEIAEEQLKDQARIIARAVENEGISYFEGLESVANRITWISADGKVLYDSQNPIEELESHADREEFIEASESGEGSSRRYSSTRMEYMTYFAYRLSDDSVLRVSVTHQSIYTLTFNMLKPILMIIAVAVALSAFLAMRLAKRIIKPLETLNLDEPLKNDAYEELAPLLTKLEHQHRQLNAHMEELTRRKNEFNTISDGMNEGMVLLDGKNNVISINKRARQLFNADENSVGKDFLTLCRRTDIQEAIASAAAGDKAELNVELGGREYQVEADPVMSGSKVQATALIFFDVTDKSRAEQMRREFTANVSHELRTPLHTISGSAEIIKDGLVEPEDVPRFAERVYEESQRMISLVEDLMRISRLDEGAEDVERLPVSLMELVEDAVERLKPSAEEKNISLNISGESGALTGVKPLLSELVYNLCDNAIKYNKENGRVDINIKEEGKRVILSVSDTGIGIERESLDRVFERFYRVDKSHSKSIGGTGLGLSIVKHAALLHGAGIELDSEPGKGTEIRVSFPV